MIRRDFLKLAGLASGGLACSLGGRSRLWAAPGGSPVTGKTVIFLFMQGGPTQFETFDPKLTAPAEIRTVGGEIDTTVPGLRFGSSLPKLSQFAHRLAVVRSFTTGTQHGGLKPIVSETTNNASLGTVYSRVLGTNHPQTGLPTSMALWPVSVDKNGPGPRDRFGRFDATGPFGTAYAPFTPGGGGVMQQNMQLKMSAEQLADRRQLLAQVDVLKTQLEKSGTRDDLASMHGQAFDMLLKGVATAFDLTREDPATLAAYDTKHFLDPKNWAASPKPKTNGPNYTAHANSLGKLLLLARRLSETGCGFISVNTEFVWDFHADANNVAIEPGHKAVIQPFDHAVSAFIEDCEARGLADKILLVCCGEMGRTPKINKNGGRDHWPKLAPLMMYGGGLTHGQVIGRSTRDGGEPDTKAFNPDNLLATIFRQLFDYGQLRLLPGIPAEIIQMANRIEKIPPIL